MIDKKARIISFLKKKGRSSTSRIAAHIKSSYWLTEQYLEDMPEIKKEKETKATYWSLK